MLYYVNIELNVYMLFSFMIALFMKPSLLTHQFYDCFVYDAFFIYSSVL